MTAVARGVSRQQRMAKLLEKYDFASLRSVPRAVTDDERLFALVRPEELIAPMRVVNGIVVSYFETCRMRRRAYVLQAWLARRLARAAADDRSATMWHRVEDNALGKVKAYRREERSR